MADSTEKRLPTVYDWESLKRGIEALAHKFIHNEPFYDTIMADPDPCQGDIIHLDCPVPIIDEVGEAATINSEGLWLMIGNTCDFAREECDVPWTQVVPLDKLYTVADINDLRSYGSARGFYVPPWPQSANGAHFLADFTRPVTIHKRAVRNVAKVEARLTTLAWALLHSCLVRFLARDDGRLR